MDDKNPNGAAAATEVPLAVDAVSIGVVESTPLHSDSNQPNPVATPLTEREVREMIASEERRSREKKEVVQVFGLSNFPYLPLEKNAQISYRELDYILSGPEGFSEERMIDMMCAKGLRKLSKAQVGILLKATCSNPPSPQKSELNKLFDGIKKAHDKVSWKGDEELASLATTMMISIYCGCACWVCTAFISCCVGGYVASEQYSQAKRVVDPEFVERRYLYAYYSHFGIAADMGMEEPQPTPPMVR